MDKRQKQRIHHPILKQKIPTQMKRIKKKLEHQRKRANQNNEAAPQVQISLINRTF